MEQLMICSKAKECVRKECPGDHMHVHSRVRACSTICEYVDGYHHCKCRELTEAEELIYAY